jgi:hypothetical protein
MSIGHVEVFPQQSIYLRGERTEEGKTKSKYGSSFPFANSECGEDVGCADVGLESLQSA